MGDHDAGDEIEHPKRQNDPRNESVIPPAITSDATKTSVRLHSIQNQHDHANHDVENQERRDLAVGNGFDDAAPHFKVDHQSNIDRERRQHRGHMDRLPTTIDHPKNEKNANKRADDRERMMLNVMERRFNQIHYFRFADAKL